MAAHTPGLARVTLVLLGDLSAVCVPTRTIESLCLTPEGKETGVFIGLCCLHATRGNANVPGATHPGLQPPPPRSHPHWGDFIAFFVQYFYFLALLLS